MRCHTYKGHFIPGCMGAAARGKDHCTCYTRPITDLEAECARLEEENGRLREQIAQAEEASSA